MLLRFYVQLHITLTLSEDCIIEENQFRQCSSRLPHDHSLRLGIKSRKQFGCHCQATKHSPAVLQQSNQTTWLLLQVVTGRLCCVSPSCFTEPKLNKYHFEDIETSIFKFPITLQRLDRWSSNLIGDIDHRIGNTRKKVNPIHTPKNLHFFLTQAWRWAMRWSFRFQFSRETLVGHCLEHCSHSAYTRMKLTE